MFSASDDKKDEIDLTADFAALEALGLPEVPEDDEPTSSTPVEITPEIEAALEALDAPLRAAKTKITRTPTAAAIDHYKSDKETKKAAKRAAWITEEGLPADFDSRPQEERRKLLWNARKDARERREAIEREDNRKKKIAAKVAKWHLPADFDALPTADQTRLYAAARQRARRATPSETTAVTTAPTRGEFEERTKLLDLWLATEGRSQVRLRPHRKRLLTGWVVLASIKRGGHDPSAAEFQTALAARGQALTRTAAWRLKGRIDDLMTTGPWKL